MPTPRCPHTRTDESYEWDNESQCEVPFQQCLDCGAEVFPADQIIWTLAPEVFDAFVAELDKPVEPDPRMQELLSRPTVFDREWHSPLGLLPVYESFSVAEGATRRHICPECGASVEAHCEGDAGYIPAHPVRA